MRSARRAGSRSRVESRRNQLVLAEMGVEFVREGREYLFNRFFMGKNRDLFIRLLIVARNHTRCLMKIFQESSENSMYNYFCAN